MKGTDIFEVLEDEGVDVFSTLDRFSDDKDLYISLLKEFIKTDPLKELKAAIANNDNTASASAVHSLKGVTLNLGLLNLADPCIEMLQLYRQNKEKEASSLLGEIEKAFSDFENKIKPYLEKEGV